VFIVDSFRMLLEIGVRAEGVVLLGPDEGCPDGLRPAV
jgi:hypothetical protein